MANVLIDRNYRVLNAAMECARENGLQGMTRACVAAIAQCAEGTVHNAFGNMKDLQDAVVAEAVKRGDARIVAMALALNHPLARDVPEDVRKKVAEEIAG